MIIKLELENRWGLLYQKEKITASTENKRKKNIPKAKKKKRDRQIPYDTDVAEE